MEVQALFSGRYRTSVRPLVPYYSISPDVRLILSGIICLPFLKLRHHCRRLVFGTKAAGKPPTHHFIPADSLTDAHLLRPTKVSSRLLPHVSLINYPLFAFVEGVPVRTLA